MDATQTVAIIVGGIWAYYKFFRGRTFARRADLTTSAALLVTDTGQAIRAGICMRNTGAIDISLTTAAVFVYEPTVDSATLQVEWNRIAASRIFEDDDSLDASEAISDEVLIPLSPVQDPVAYRVQYRIYANRGRGFTFRTKPGAIRWLTNVVVPSSVPSPLKEVTIR